MREIKFGRCCPSSCRIVAVCSSSLPSSPLRSDFTTTSFFSRVRCCSLLCFQFVPLLSAFFALLLACACVLCLFVCCCLFSSRRVGFSEFVSFVSFSVHVPTLCEWDATCGSRSTGSHATAGLFVFCFPTLLLFPAAIHSLPCSSHPLEAHRPLRTRCRIFRIACTLLPLL